MSAKEVMQMNFMFDKSVNRIVGYRDLVASPEIGDKSSAHLNTLFSRYIKKYNNVVEFILIANIYCDKSKTYYNSLFDSSEIPILEEVSSQGSIVEVSFFVIYDKQRYTNKREVIQAYEKQNFVASLSDNKIENIAKEKDTQKIKKVWLNEKDKADVKVGSQGNSQEGNFYKNNKANSIASFFKKPA